MSLSERIKKLRNDNKLTQEQFADKMLVSRSVVSKWEKGICYPSIDSLKNMSVIFNVSFDDFLSSEEIIDIVKDENYNNISKYNGFLFCVLDIIRMVFIFLPLYSYKLNNFVYSVSLFDSNDLGFGLKIILMIMFIMFFVLGIIELILNSRKCNGVLNKMSLIFDIVSIFIILFINQSYLVVLMFIFFVIKVVMLLNMYESVSLER